MALGPQGNTRGGRATQSGWSNPVVIAQGRVQGVGFRFTVRGLARECKVTGWVKNLDDGDVLIEAQGTPDQVSALTDAIKRESARERTWVRATLATREELAPQQEQDFRIVH